MRYKIAGHRSLGVSRRQEHRDYPHAAPRAYDFDCHNVHRRSRLRSELDSSGISDRLPERNARAYARDARAHPDA